MFIGDIITGKVSKKKFAWIFIPSVLFLIVSWFIARLLWNNGVEGYFWDQNMISSHGNLNNNPIGGWFFIISTVIAGFNMLFFSIFLARRFWRTFWPFTVLFLLCGSVGGIGFALVGATPEGSGPTIGYIHGLGTNMAFMGLGAAAGMSFLICVIRLLIKKPWPTPSQFLLVFGIVFQIGIMIIFTETPSIMQWSGFHTILIWAILMFLIVPDDANEPSK